MNKDPIRLGGGINEFEYVNSNPLKYVDREGLAKNPPTPGNATPSSLRKYAKLCGYVCTEGTNHTKCKIPSIPGSYITIPRHSLNPNTARGIINTIKKFCHQKPAPVPVTTPSTVCEDNCKKVLTAVFDTVTGLLILTWAIICSPFAA